MINKIISLPTDVVPAINKFISQKKLNENPLLRDGVFSLLEQYCTVLYYPQENEENDGCHIKRLVNDKVVNFVFINTHKSIEKQVFTAAHELGHILDLDIYLKDNCPDYSSDMEEIAMNKLAALLLMPENIFTKELQEHFKNYSTEEGKITLDNLIKLSLFLMDLFFVPFKAVIIRLFELGYLSKKDAEEIIYDTTTLNKINDYIKLLGYKRLGIRSQKKSIKDFAEILERAETLEVFPETKLKSIREKMDLPDIKSESLSTTIKFNEPKSE